MKILEVSAAASPEQYHDTEITIIFELFLFSGAASSRSLCYSANLLNGLDSRMSIHQLRHLSQRSVVTGLNCGCFCNESLDNSEVSWFAAARTECRRQLRRSREIGRRGTRR